MKTYTIDFRNVRHFSEVHATIAEGLEFPDYYGGNWDAFWDCLSTEMDLSEPFLIEIFGLEVIEQNYPDYAKKMLEILKKFKYYWDDAFPNEHLSDDIRIETVKGDQRIAIV